MNREPCRAEPFLPEWPVFKPLSRWRRFKVWWSEHNHRHRWENDPDCPTCGRSCARCLVDEVEQ